MASSHPFAGQTIGAYTLLSKIGQGGMGSVWLAERTDGEIQRKVAIKLPDAESHTPASREHFLMERQLLASLNHPSIVRVIDAGHTLDDRPYLVMEYVEGVAIDIYAAGIATRDRLELFLRVCDGVAHAHRRLIIHRDLKPSNILVDATGQPKLLDFGIARMLDDAGDPTRTAGRLLTPDYASPEQRRGETQTTATDVYSLGAVLYRLVTGRLPCEATAGTAGLPSDIGYIVRKALRPEPEERYASVDAFANDIRAVLESRPVHARSGDRWYRARKLLRRYWMPASAIALIVCSLSVGLWVANRERAIAQGRFQQVRELAHAYVFNLHDEIAKLQGSTKTREMIVRTGLEYLDSLARDAGGQLDLQKEIAAAYMKVGDAEGFPTTPNLGRTEDALASYRKAGDLYGRIASKDARYLPDLARYYMKYAELMRLTHNLRRARELSESAIQTFDRMRARQGLDPASQQSYLGAWCTLGDMDEELGHYRQAWTEFSRCRDLARARLGTARDRQALSSVALADERIGTAAQELGFLTEALRALDEDESVIDELLAAEPRNPRLQRRRALVDHYRSTLYYADTSANFGDPARALESARRYLKRTEEMTLRDPNDTSARFSRGIATYQVAFCLREFDADGAVAMARKSVRIFDELIASGKASYLITSRRARAMLRLGEAQFRAGHVREALRTSETVLAEVRPLAGKGAAEAEEHVVLVLALILAGQTNAASGNFDRAESLLREAREEAQSIAKGQELENIVPLANSERASGAYYTRRERIGEARACYQRLVDLWQRFPEANEYVERQRTDAVRLLASFQN
jgi:serine/threonine protein kinase